MEIEAHDALRRPTRVRATQAVVRDWLGQPVAVLLEPAPGRIECLLKGDPGFDDACRLLGVADPALLVRGSLPAPPQITL